MSIKAILNTFVPYQCLVCNVEGDFICKNCLALRLDSSLIPSRCFLCQAQTENFATCNKCRKKAPVSNVLVGTAYKGVAVELVKRLKFGPDRTVAELLAYWMDESVSFIDADVVTWVPTARVRVRQRGFDHTRLIARDFADRRSLVCKPTLQRVGKAKQVGLPREQRQNVLKDAFLSNSDLTGKRVLIIDDVVTTGSTLSECARVLKRAGAKSVHALVFAQAI